MCEPSVALPHHHAWPGVSDGAASAPGVSAQPPTGPSPGKRGRHPCLSCSRDTAAASALSCALTEGRPVCDPTVHLAHPSHGSDPSRPLTAAPTLSHGSAGSPGSRTIPLQLALGGGGRAWQCQPARGDGEKEPLVCLTKGWARAGSARGDPPGAQRCWLPSLGPLTCRTDGRGLPAPPPSWAACASWDRVWETGHRAGSGHQGLWVVSACLSPVPQQGGPVAHCQSCHRIPDLLSLQSPSLRAWPLGGTSRDLRRSRRDRGHANPRLSQEP